MDVEQRHTREMTVATKHTTNQKKQKKKKTNRKRARSNMSIIVWGEKHRQRRLTRTKHKPAKIVWPSMHHI